MSIMMKLRLLRYKIRRFFFKMGPPYKGNCAYELQVLPFVLQWRYDGKAWSPDKYGFTGRGLTIGPFHAWIDKDWMERYSWR